MTKTHGGLDFERPLLEAEAKLEALFAEAVGRFVSLQEVSKARRKVRRMRHDVFSKLTPWQRTQIARHPARPYFLDFARHMFEDAIEIRGDRAFGDDQSIVTLLARFEGRSVVAIGHQKGRNVKENIQRNFGMPNPEGYRKALRALRLADKFGKPVLTFIDTPGAYPGIGAEERGQSEAIARAIQEMTQLGVPVIATVIGEGGSGGALAIGVGNRVLMLQHAIYSVISPEACAAILWRDDRSRAPEAAETLRYGARDALGFGLIDEIVREPLGGAHRNHAWAANLLRRALRRNLAALEGIPREELVRLREEKFLAMGKFSEGKS
ncbi:MAG TPA: acetyl-CoA carboxylase carboxyltransferase subunit alpha [bacterium]